MLTVGRWDIFYVYNKTHVENEKKKNVSDALSYVYFYGKVVFLQEKQ